MRRTAAPLAWLIWRRHRWPAALLLTYGTGLALATHACLPGPASTRLSLSLASLPLLFGLLYLMAAFAYPDADLTSPHSGFPRPMLILPARTGELVFWPMLFGTSLIALAWVGLARTILIPAGVVVPIGWAAALLAGWLACLQALCWSPLGLPYLRLVVALLLFPSLAAAGIIASLNGVAPASLTAAYLALIAVAYAAAVAGLAHARRGDSPEWRWLLRRAGSAGAAAPGARAPLALASSLSPHAPFASPLQAQLWLEWRRHGLMGPLFVGGLCLLLTIPLAWIHDLAPLGASGLFPSLRDLELNLWVKLQQGCLFWPVILSGISGGLRSSRARRGDLSLPPFVAARPMSGSAFVFAKLQMAAWSTLAAWAVLLLFVFGWLLTPARLGDRSGPLLLFLLRAMTPKTGLLLLPGLLLLVFWTWKNQAESLCIEMTGRRWLVYGFPAAVYGLGLAAFVLFAHWSSGPREIDLRHTSVPTYVPWLVGLAVTLKAVGTVSAMRALLRRRLAAPRLLGGLVAGWLLTAAGLFAWLLALERAGLFDGCPLPPALFVPGYLAAAAVLFVPLARLALAPLALEWNRHR
jgi:hypothetical protein